MLSPFILAMAWVWLVLLTSAAVATATSGTPPCSPAEYELGGFCCHLCLAGFYVVRNCDADHVTQCSPCEPGSFTAHRNRETSCLPCAECRKDQEVVTECTRDRDRRCQCKTGSFYCDSEDCAESCYRCSRCDGPTVQACNATRDTVCVAARNPGPGDPAGYCTGGFCTTTAVTIAVGIVSCVIVVIVFVGITYLCRRGTQLPRLVTRWLKHESRDSDDPSQGSTELRAVLLSADTERNLLAPDADPTLLLEREGSAGPPGARPPLVPSEDPAGGTELQAVVARGSRAASEQALQTQAPVAPGRPDQTGAAAPLHVLEQKYKQEYVLKDESPDAVNRIYYVFGQEVPESNWRMFMRFVGLKENDIDICEHENQGNVMEQRHKMLVRWQSQQGRAASPFRLLAALYKMQLRDYLENIINRLVAENILGSKHAEPPN